MDESDFFEPSPAPVAGPLAGIRVVEATTTLAGPMCGCVLADLGADVVKIELPGGEVVRRLPPFLPGTNPPLSFFHAHVNRNKRSLCLDLHADEGREVFLDLARRSDVVVQNFRPGTMDEWGVGYAAVRAVKPDIIYASISGFGQYGPDHDQCGYDPLAQAAGGFMSLNGEVDGAPMRSPTFLADDLAGLHGAVAVLAALLHRARTGEGQYIDLSQWETSMAVLPDALVEYTMNGTPPARDGNRDRHLAPHGIFRAAGHDRWIAVAVEDDAAWVRLAALLGGPEL
ncbi:MAG TPA: CoA transferase, partial [Acidimicrobiia bacterium]|nr:CoA transferase [Acidimicrobiia bacterium]